MLTTGWRRPSLLRRNGDGRRRDDVYHEFTVDRFDGLDQLLATAACIVAAPAQRQGTHDTRGPVERSLGAPP